MDEEKSGVATLERPVDPHIDRENQWLQTAAGMMPLSEEELKKYRDVMFGGLSTDEIKDILDDKEAIPTLPDLNLEDSEPGVSPRTPTSYDDI
jgi:hypothetical protein